jgi:hypothetical protein
MYSLLLRLTIGRGSDHVTITIIGVRVCKSEGVDAGGDGWGYKKVVEKNLFSVIK